LTLFAGAALALFAMRLWWPVRTDSQAPFGDSSLALSQHALENGTCEIIRAVDGNTVHVAQQGRQFRVRLLGVSGCNDPRAVAFAGDLAKTAEVSIELDKRRAAADGAWLAYLFADGQLVNAAILRSGWGRYDPYPGDSPSHGRQLREAEAAARREQLGMWAAL
jgi:micrococcal nuclease